MLSTRQYEDQQVRCLVEQGREDQARGLYGDDAVDRVLTEDGWDVEAARTGALRKRTVFSPCERHQAMFSTETRQRRAEIMCEGGYANSPCSGGGCRMKPGTDIYCESLVRDYPETGIVGR